MVDQAKLFFRNTGLSAGGAPNFRDTKTQTQTGSKPAAGRPNPHDSSEKASTGSKDAGPGLAALGEFLMRGHGGFAPLAPRIAGQAAQSAPILNPQFQIDPTTLAVLSQLLGGR